MVTVLKNDKVRICLDPKDLNWALRRERYQIPTVKDVIDSMSQGSTIFSVIVSKSGFLQFEFNTMAI